MPQYAPKALSLTLVHPAAHSVLRAPSLLQLALHHVSNALAATTVLLAPHHGLILIVAEAATAQMGLVLLRPALFKCLQLADGALYKCKAPLSSWKQPNASNTASGTSRQATAC